MKIPKNLDYYTIYRVHFYVSHTLIWVEVQITDIVTDKNFYWRLNPQERDIACYELLDILTDVGKFISGILNRENDISYYFGRSMTDAILREMAAQENLRQDLYNKILTFL